MSEEKKIINISLVDVIKILGADKRKLFIYSVVAGVIGVALAFATPHTYKSTVMLAPEESNKGFSGSISSLASMVGMNMKVGQTGDALYPEIYPDLMESTDFVVGLFPITVTKDKTGEKFTYFDYLQNHQKMAFYEWPKALLTMAIDKLVEEPEPGPGHKVDPFRLTKNEFGIVKSIKGNMSCSVDKKTSVITITLKDQDPLIAATMVDTIKQHLQKSITEYRTKKAKVDLEYMKKLYAETKSDYDRARQRYATYADANMDAELQAVKSKMDDLENEMQLKYNIYQQVVEQLQLAKAKVQESTPAFTVMQNATIPVKHADRPKFAILIVWMILGFIIRFSMLVWKNKEKFFNVA